MKVLFVCTGNTCRSPMAEGILKSIAKEKKLQIDVYSAGISVFEGDGAAKNAIKAMEKIGIDISEHLANGISRKLVKETDLILTMSISHRDFILLNFPEAVGKTSTLKDYAYKVDKSVADPYGGSLAMYEKTRDEIYQAIEKIIDNGQLKR